MAISICMGVLLVLLAGGCAAGPGGEESSGTSSSHQVPAGDSRQPLRQFCGDAELDAWFDGLEENAPVKLTYIEFGMAPVSMEFTDSELILEAAGALQTVQIGGPSTENPDFVNDAGGEGYYFEMADGKRFDFTFLMGCFKWKNGGYHDVSSYGGLLETGQKLSRIGNPQYEYVYAEDNGFYTKYLESYRTVWHEEDGYGGGVFIYLSEADAAPYVSIARCTAVDAAWAPADTPSEAGPTPESILNGPLAEAVEEEIQSQGAVVSERSAVQEMEIAGKKLFGVQYLIEPGKDAADGSEASTADTVGSGNETFGPEEMLVLVLQEEDTLLRKPAFIRFTAAYHLPPEEAQEPPDPSRKSLARDQEKVMAALEAAVKEFYFHYMPYEHASPEPGCLLFDFVGDRRLQSWIENIEDHMPDELTYTEDTWHRVTDPELIRRTLEALQTVRIGDVSSKHVGGSGRKIFDFGNSEYGLEQSFMFFEDTFFWQSKSYDVLDWGELTAILPELR